MIRRPKSIRELCGCQSGSTAVEFALVSLVMVFAALGTIEFGRALLVRNELSYAADLATRRILIDASVTDAELQQELRGAITSADPSKLQITVGTETIDSRSYRTVAASYPLTLLVPGLTQGAIHLSVDRRVPAL